MRLKNNSLITYVIGILKKGLLTIFTTSVITNILGFIASTIVVRFISKADYGVYTYADNQLRFFRLISGLGATSGILQLCSEISDDEKKAESIFSFGCKMGISVNLILAALILVYSYIAVFPIDGADNLVRIMCLLPAFVILPELQINFFRSRIRNREYAVSCVIKASISCVLLIFGSYFFKVYGLIIGTYLTPAITALIIAFLFKLPVLFGKHEKLSKHEKIDFLKVSSISMTNNAISELLYLLDIFLIAMFIGDEEIIASYKIATIFPTAMVFVPGALVTFIYPYFARHKDDHNWVRKNYIRVIFGSLAIDGAAVLVFFIIAPWLIKFLYGAAYLDAVIPFRILIVGFAFSGTFRIISGNLLVTQRQLKFNTFVSIVSGVLNIIADILFIQWWGSVGAAVATVMVQVISGILNTSRMFYVVRKSKKSM